MGAWRSRAERLLDWELASTVSPPQSRREGLYGLTGVWQQRGFGKIIYAQPSSWMWERWPYYLYLIAKEG